MGSYDLIKQLQDPKTDKTPLPRGVTYDQYTVLEENKEVTVNIPRREKQKFERILDEQKSFTREELKTLLRDLRGVRG